MLKELTLNSTVYREKALKGLPPLFRELYRWIRSIKACICSAVGAETASKVCCGRATGFCCCTNAWTAECFVGHGMKRRQGCYPNKKSVGFWRAWSLNNPRQLRNPNRGFCIKRTNLQAVTEMFAGNLQTFPFFYGI